jgi:hypothetical protein
VSPEELYALPAVVDVTTAGRLLGVGRGAAYELVRTGQWPTPVVRLGRLIKVPTAPLLALLGLLGLLGQPVQATAGARSGSPSSESGE